jgi:hypothetical protein
MQNLAIVGTHSATRDNAPWDDIDYEIWVFNEAPQQDWCKRWDVAFQMHLPEVYSSPNNHVRADHWDWLQRNHGPDKLIYMQAHDPRVPNCRVYPLDGVLGMVPFRFLTSTASMALALAIKKGFERISVYGVEMTSNSEYSYQAENWIFWVGYALGMGIELDLQSGQMHFEGKIYGYEGDPVLVEFYEERVKILTGEYHALDTRLGRIDDVLRDAMMKNKYDLVAQAVIDTESAATDAGAIAGALGEAEMYQKRGRTITPRQEFERRAAQAQIDGEQYKALMHNAGGKAEYVWNVWKQHGNNEALNQLRQFVKDKRQHAYNLGARLGAYNENILYMKEFDKRANATGGIRALEYIAHAN